MPWPIDQCHSRLTAVLRGMDDPIFQSIGFAEVWPGYTPRVPMVLSDSDTEIEEGDTPPPPCPKRKQPHSKFELHIIYLTAKHDCLERLRARYPTKQTMDNLMDQYPLAFSLLSSSCSEREGGSAAFPKRGSNNHGSDRHLVLEGHQH